MYSSSVNLSFQTGPVIPMAVPSSFNDITQDDSLRKFVGWVWYDRKVYVPKSWQNEDLRVVLRFESAHYNTVVVSMMKLGRGGWGPLDYLLKTHEEMKNVKEFICM